MLGWHQQLNGHEFEQARGDGEGRGSLVCCSLCAVLFLVAQSCLTLCNPLGCSPPGSSVHGDSPGRNTGVGCYSLLQIIFPTKGLNPGLLGLYGLSHRRRPYRFLYFVNIQGILPNIPLSAIPGDFEKGELTYTLLLVYWDSALTALELTSEFLLFSHSVTSKSL